MKKHPLGVSNKKSFKYEAQTLESLSIHVRSFTKVIGEYELQIAEIKSLIAGIGIFSSINEVLFVIDADILETKQIIQQSIDNDFYRDMQSDMNMMAVTIGESLDGAPSGLSLSRHDYKAITDDVILIDIETLAERISERVLKIGYGLCDYLMSAKF
jgi:hypothetical protein